MVVVHSTPKVELVYTNLHDAINLLRSYLSEIYGRDVFYEALRRRHASVSEFITFVFKIRCSRVTSHQLVRHRIASYIQESQRYSIQKPDFIVPRSLMRTEIIELVEKLYDKYEELVRNGLKCELARYILPNCAATTLLCQWNLRELIEVIIPLRLCRRAQPEIRYIAYRIASILAEKMPELTELHLIGCRGVLLGKCPEYSKLVDIKKCLEASIVEALREHGTDEEVIHSNEIASWFVCNVLKL